MSIIFLISLGTALFVGKVNFLQMGQPLAANALRDIFSMGQGRAPVSNVLLVPRRSQ